MHLEEYTFVRAGTDAPNRSLCLSLLMCEPCAGICMEDERQLKDVSEILRHTLEELNFTADFCGGHVFVFKQLRARFGECFHIPQGWRGSHRSEPSPLGT